MLKFRRMNPVDDVRTEYARIIRASDWFKTRSRPWRERIIRHPFLTVWYAIIDKYWKVVIRLGLHDSFLFATTFWGDQMRVTFPDYRSIYHHGLIDGRELPVEDYLVRNLREGDTFIDVGANIGFYSLLASALVGKFGKVYAFEPTPRTFTLLVWNTSAKSNVILKQAALMERAGVRELSDYGVEKSGLNTIIPLSIPDDIEPTKISVEATTLDAYCSEYDIRPTLIKIDTEGAEEMVLRGGREILTTHHPVLIIEVQRKSPETVIELLESVGYRAQHYIENTVVPYNIGEPLQCPNMLFTYQGP